jgi:predicted phage-related endonuclease
MKTLTFTDRESWLEARAGKITGSKRKDLADKRGSGKKKIGWFRLLAEHLAKPEPLGESPMDRGARLEAEAIDRFEKETGKKVDRSLVIWTSDADERIAVSPDGFMGKTEALEIKCLGSEYHLQAWYTKEIPDEYQEQKEQYFTVNPKLKKLYFAFYDPRLPEKIAFFFLEVKREDIKEDIEKSLIYQTEILGEIDKLVTELTF